MAEVIAQVSSFSPLSSWEYLKCPKIVEIFQAQLSAHVGNPSNPEMFRQIFEEIQDSDEFQTYVATVFLESKDIYFVSRMKASTNGASFLDVISAKFVESSAITDRLISMDTRYRHETGGFVTSRNASDGDW